MELDRLPPDDPRRVLDALARASGDDYSALSKMIGRNAAYIQQFIKRGTPKRLDERDRRVIAEYFGVDEARLGAPKARAPSSASRRATPSRRGARRQLAPVPRLDIGAAAGAGALAGDERGIGSIGFDPDWLRREGLDARSLSIVRVRGDSMEPTLGDGDEIMVDTADGAERLRDGLYVIRRDDGVMVKRLVLAPRRGHVAIVSDNPAYPRFEDISLSEIALVGRVVWAARRLG